MKYKMCLSKSLFLFPENQSNFSLSWPECFYILSSFYFVILNIVHVLIKKQFQGCHLNHSQVFREWHFPYRSERILNPQSSSIFVKFHMCCCHCSTVVGTFEMTGVRLNTLEPFSYATRKLRREHLRCGRSAWRAYGTCAVVICNEDTLKHVRSLAGMCRHARIWLSSRANHMAI